MNTLYLVRHGQTEWNVQRRMQGRLDSPLTATGRAQAEANARVLKANARVGALIASPSGRTRETAYILNSRLRAPLSFDETLMERDCGAWSGLTMDEIAAGFPGAWQARQADPYHHRPPGGENFEDMVGRVRGFLDDLFVDDPGDIVLVTHSALSRAILAYYLALGPVELGKIRHPNDAIYRLQFHPTHIDSAHFVAGDGPHGGLLHRSDNETIPRLDGSTDPRGNRQPGGGIDES